MIEHKRRIVRKVYIGFSGLGLISSLLGYSLHLLPNTALADLPATLGGIVLSSLHLFIPRPDVILDPSTPELVRIAAFLCGVSGFIAAALIWIRVANRSISGLWAQFFLRRHVLVIGDGDFSTRFSKFLSRSKRTFLHVVDSAYVDNDTGQQMLLDLTPERLIRRAGLNRSETIVVDLGSDIATMAKANAILAKVSKDSRIKNMAVRIGDAVISDRFSDHLHTRVKRPRTDVSVFDENRILARHTLSQRPLFACAHQRGQAKVHTLIIGFGDLGEKLLDQVVLTSLAYDLVMPRITIVDRAAAKRKAEFNARRPRVLSQLDIEFIEFDLEALPSTGADLHEGAKALHSAELQDPLTMIYVSLPDFADVTRIVLLLNRLQRQFGLFRAPISYRCQLDQVEQDVLEEHPSPDIGAETGFLRMSLSEDGLMSVILGLEEADIFAMRIHEAYRAMGLASAEADKDWNELPDTFKRANRRAGDHIQAKLATAGIRLEIGVPLSIADRRKLEELQTRADNDPMMMKLAKLEHERWCLDRYLDGWTYGETDDETKRMRRTLVPFEALSDEPEQIEKDINQVRQIIRIVLDQA